MFVMMMVKIHQLMSMLIVVMKEVNNLSDGELRDYRLILGVEKENKSTSLWCVSSV
ncbi:19810_t:CDS:2 [Funneliformis geosporum]|uniref:19810_t:CDS:1 n=1 Tax=Funneliformis geosporum TaxID=1117311 RepID=A0A9W4SW98_9GLOM|nr:19810_t:CDS:2 [Funneliformis geosporum]